MMEQVKTLPLDFNQFDEVRPAGARPTESRSTTTGVLPLDFQGFDEVIPTRPQLGLAPVPAHEPQATLPPPRPEPSVFLKPTERTGTHFEADPNDVGPEVRLGRMLPEAAVPALSWFQRNINEPRERMARVGTQAMRGVVDEALTAAHTFAHPPSFVLPMGPVPPGKSDAERLAEMEQRHPIATGVSRAVAETAGSTVTDPTNWPFFGSGSARPLLQRLISGGFAAQMGIDAVTTARELHDNWDNLTPAQRAEMATQAGLSAAMTAGAGLHAVKGEGARVRRTANPSAEPQVRLETPGSEPIVRPEPSPPDEPVTLPPEPGEPKVTAEDALHRLAQAHANDIEQEASLDRLRSARVADADQESALSKIGEANSADAESEKALRRLRAANAANLPPQGMTPQVRPSLSRLEGPQVELEEAAAQAPRDPDQRRLQAITNEIERMEREGNEVPRGTRAEHERLTSKLREMSSDGEPIVQAPEETDTEGEPKVELPGRPSQVRLVDPRTLKTDPARFQWRMVPRNAIPEGAAWDQAKAGPLDIWRDPENSQWYVVEGHHRFNHAVRKGVQEVEVRAHQFEDAKEARAYGARRNIELGNATPFDAALYLRESGLTPDQLRNFDMNLNGELAQKGTALANLSGPLWEQYRSADLSEAKAVAIGQHLSEPAQQAAMAKLAQKKNLGSKELEQLARRIQERGNTVGQTDTLFGTEAHAESNAVEEAKFAVKVEHALQTDKKALGFVANAPEARRKALARGENIINVEKSNEQAMIANALAEGFRRLQNRTGKVYDLLAEAGRRLTAKEKHDAVFNRLYPEIRDAILQEVGESVPRSEPAGGSGAEVRTGGRSPESEGTRGEEATKDFKVELPENPTEKEPVITVPEEPSLPGMEGHVTAQREAAAEEQGRQLTVELGSHKTDISEKTGDMERESPLFRDSEASGQGGLFRDEPKVEGPDEKKNPQGGTLYSGTAVADPRLWRELFPSATEVIGHAVEKITSKELTAGDLEKGILREGRGELDRKKAILYESLKQHAKRWEKASAEDSRNFIDKIESGRVEEITNPDDRFLAEHLRDMLDERRDLVRALKPGALQHFIEDYFPHFWENPTKARRVFQQVLGSKRPFQGPASFLKQRTIPTFEEGIAKGLKPVTYNPVDLALLKLHEMDRFIYAHDAMAKMKRTPFNADPEGKLKLANYAEVGSDREQFFRRLGWAKYDDRVGTVYGRNTVPLEEWHDRNAITALEQTLENFGIEHARDWNRPKRQPGALGVSHQGGDFVETKFATPMSILAHELGHQLDHRFNLADDLVKNKLYKKELRDLADLVYEGHDPAMVPESFKRYVRSAPEKIAHIFEAWIGARERMQEVAPNTYNFVRQFMQEHEELQPLLDYKPTLSYKKNVTERRIPGMVIQGYYWGPRDAVKYFNRNLSPGLVGRSTAYDIYRGASNALNQAQLGISAFHLGFTSLDAATSDLALAIEKVARGDVKGSLAPAARAATFASPITTWLTGNKLLKEYLKPGSYEQMTQLANAVAQAGGRAFMDPFYHNEAMRGFRTAIKDGRYGRAAARAVPAFLEAAAKPVMEWVVPRQKLGVFASLATDVLERARKGNWEDTRTRAELQKAWDSVDNRMGQLVYDNLFWNRSAKDLGLASVRSLGWNLGTVREIGGGLKDIGVEATRKLTGKDAEVTHRMAYIMGLTIFAGYAGALYHYLSTGKQPEEIKDYYFPKGPTGNRVSLPTYMKDIYAWRHHPLQTAGHKIHPAISEVIAMLQNRDFYGNEIRNEDDPIVQQAWQVAKYAGKGALPFSIRNWIQTAKNGENVALGGVQSFVGITPAPSYINRTEAANRAAEYVNRNRGQGTRTSEQAAIHERRSDLERAIRSGRLDKEDLKRRVRAGELTVDDVRTAFQSSRVDPLVRDVRGLPIEQALKVFEIANNDERKLLLPVLLKKAQQLRARTPEERAPLKKQLMRAFGKKDEEPKVELTGSDYF